MHRQIYIGTSGYSYPAWKGRFYPPSLSTKKMLSFYASQFNTVEANSTFYRLPKLETFHDWASQVPRGFRFAVKSPRRITHERRLAEAAPEVERFLTAVEHLGAACGPILFQLPPFLRRDDDRLSNFLRNLPTGKRFAFEFRHASWFDEKIFSMLSDREVALCIADVDEDGTCTPFMQTAEWGYLRLRRADYTEDDLQSWALRLSDSTWKEVYIFFKHEDEARGPALAIRLRGMLDGS